MSLTCLLLSFKMLNSLDCWRVSCCTSPLPCYFSCLAPYSVFDEKWVWNHINSFRPRLSDLVDFQQRLQMKKLDCGHHWTLELLAQLWYLQLKTLVERKRITEALPSDENARLTQQSFQECARIWDQVNSAFSASSYDEDLWEDKLQAKVMYDTMLLDCDTWKFDRRENEKQKEIRPRIFQDICNNFDELRAKSQHKGLESESFVHRFAHFCFKALTTRCEQELEAFDEDGFSKEHENQFSDIDEKNRVRLNRLIYRVLFYLHLRFRPEFGAKLGRSQLVSNFADFEYKFEESVQRLMEAVHNTYLQCMSEGCAIFWVELQQLAGKCVRLMNLLPEGPEGAKDTNLLRTMSEKIMMAAHYMEPEMVLDRDVCTMGKPTCLTRTSIPMTQSHAWFVSWFVWHVPTACPMCYIDVSSLSSHRVAFSKLFVSNLGTSIRFGATISWDTHDESLQGLCVHFTWRNRSGVWHVEQT